MKYEILYKATINGELATCVCNERDANSNYWGFTATEKQAQDRVADLKAIGIEAWYNEINNDHWVNNGWIG